MEEDDSSSYYLRPTEIEEELPVAIEPSSPPSWSRGKASDDLMLHRSVSYPPVGSFRWRLDQEEPKEEEQKPQIEEEETKGLMQEGRMAAAAFHSTKIEEHAIGEGPSHHHHHRHHQTIYPVVGSCDTGHAYVLLHPIAPDHSKRFVHVVMAHRLSFEDPSISSSSSSPSPTTPIIPTPPTYPSVPSLPPSTIDSSFPVIIKVIELAHVTKLQENQRTAYPHPQQQQQQQQQQAEEQEDSFSSTIHQEAVHPQQQHLEEVQEEEEDDDADDDCFFIGELAAMERLAQSPPHPNVVPLVEAMMDETYLFIVTPYVEGGELFDLVAASSQGLPEGEARHCFKQMVEGLLHLKRHGLSHGDVSLENVMFTRLPGCDHDYAAASPTAATDGSSSSSNSSSNGNNNNGQLLCRLIDLEMAHMLYDPSRPELGGRGMYGGKPSYIAPEVVEGVAKDWLAADVWSLAIALYIMLTGRPLYASLHDYAFDLLVKGGAPGLLYHFQTSYGLYISPLATDLICMMLRPNPSDRPTLEQIAEHPWVITTTTTTSTTSSLPFSCAPPPSSSACAARQCGHDDDNEKKGAFPLMIINPQN